MLFAEFSIELETAGNIIFRKRGVWEHLTSGFKLGGGNLKTTIVWNLHTGSFNFALWLWLRLLFSRGLQFRCLSVAFVFLLNIFCRRDARIAEKTQNN